MNKIDDDRFELITRNLRSCRLGSNIKNKKAIRFWKKLGFREDIMEFKKRI